MAVGNLKRVTAGNFNASAGLVLFLGVSSCSSLPGAGLWTAQDIGRAHLLPRHWVFWDKDVGLSCLRPAQQEPQARALPLLATPGRRP